MRKTSLTLVSLFLIAPWASADIYKCEGENGLAVYKNFPCEVDSIGSRATAVAPKEAAAAPVTPPAPLKSRGKGDQLAATAAPAGPKVEPRVGMTVKELKASSWGDPYDIVGEELMEGVFNTWHFKDKGKVLVNPSGRVVSVQR